MSIKHLREIPTAHPLRVIIRWEKNFAIFDHCILQMIQDIAIVIIEGV